jgi:hypothetical protein
MPDITKDLAEDIVRKLRQQPANSNLAPFEITSQRGANHDIYKVRHSGAWVGQFGILRGSKKNARHNWVSEQLHLNRQQGYDLAKCPLTIDDFIVILQQNEVIPASQ